MNFVIRTFLIAVQFLTIIPVSLRKAPTPREKGYSLLHYPVVGLLLGLLWAMLAGVLAQAPAMLAAALMLASGALATGCLHLDGLADSADAWLGGRGSRKATLDIMKDPCSGPMAVSVLVLTLLTKFSALSALLQQGVSVALYIIPVVLSRTAILLVILFLPYVREHGLGEDMIKHQSVIATSGSVVISLIGVILLAGSGAVEIITIYTMTLGLLFYLVHRRLGGTTGDTIGAVTEITETVLLAASVWIFVGG